jgi:hypothetical protein
MITVIGHAEVVIEVSFTLTTDEQPAPDTTIKAEDIQTTIGDHIKDLKDIDAVNTELAKYAKGGENAIDGVETLKAELADRFRNWCCCNNHTINRLHYWWWCNIYNRRSYSSTIIVKLILFLKILKISYIVGKINPVLLESNYCTGICRCFSI